MSFYFKEIHLKNWLVYEEAEVKLDDHQPDQNLFVFHGKNGYGKTSLLKALEYVFHGRVSHQEAFRFYNDKAKEKDAGEMSVRLKFMHDGRTCQLTRGVTFQRKPNGDFKSSPMVELIIDGESRDGQIEDIVSQIIPEDSRQFVFFDGAEITRYAERQHDTGVKDAIEQILGIPAVRNLRDDLAKLISDLESEQEGIVRQNAAQSDLISRKQDANDFLEVYKADKKKLQESQNSIRAFLDRLRKDEADVQAIESNVKLLQSKTEQIKDYEDKKAELDEQIETIIRKASLYMLAGPISKMIKEGEAAQTVAQKRQAGAGQKKLILEILEDELCICGNEVDSDMMLRLKSKLEELEPASSTNEFLNQDQLRTLNRVHSYVQDNPVNGTALATQRATVFDRISELETDQSELRKTLAGHENTQISDLYQQRDAQELRLQTTIEDISKINIQIEEKEKELSGIQRELDELTVTDQQGAGIMRTLEKTRSMHKAVSEYVDELIELRRAETEKLTSEIFLEITNKPDEYAGVNVKPDYTLSVYRKDKSDVDNAALSAGEKEVLAYSFMTALNLSSVNPAPFVMDTPFGHLDSGHRAALLDSLPQLGVQVFLLATDRDMPEAEHERIRGSIAQDFILNRNQRKAKTTIEEGRS